MSRRVVACIFILAVLSGIALPFTLHSPSPLLRAMGPCAEPGGYLSICQAPNGLIHLITSRQHQS